MPDDLRTINDADYKTVLKRRAHTIRLRLRQKISDEQFPDHDDALLKELRMLRSIARLLRIRLP